MKKNLFLCILFFSITSCVKEENLYREKESIPDDSGITFHEEVPTTRTNEISTFTEGDAVGVFAVKVGNSLKAIGNYVDNYKYVFDASKKAFVGADIKNTVFGQGQNLKYFVYYPYRAQVLDATKMLHILSGNTKEDDFLLAIEEADKKNIGLSFKHLLAKVSVVLDKDKSTATGVNLSSYTDVNISLNGNISTIINRRVDIPLYKSLSGKWEGVSVPQTYLKGEKVLSVTLSGSNQSYSFPENRTIASGQVNEFSFMGKTLIYDFFSAPTAITASAPENSYTLTITSLKNQGINGVKLPGTSVTLPYSLGSKPTWTSITGSTLSVSENTSSSPRTGVVTFTQTESGKQLGITVNQAAATISNSYIFTLDNGSTAALLTNVSSSGVSKSYSIISTEVEVINGKAKPAVNISYMAQSSVSWITVSGSTLSVSENTQSTPRGGVVTFTQSKSGKQIKITITQTKKNEIIIN